MKITIISDQHGNLPKNLPSGDLLLICGDICPVKNHTPGFQTDWINTIFGDWLNTLQYDKIIFIGGNHDFALQTHKEHIDFLNLDAQYLEDWETEYEGLKIWGTPWVPNLPTWAFHKNEYQLAEIFGKIPLDTDILISHGPPYGILDEIKSYCYKNNEEQWPQTITEHVGSYALRERLEDLKNLKYLFCGHIHEGYGTYKLGDTTIINASLLDEKYTLKNKPVVINL